MKISDVIWRVEKRAVLALAIFALLAGAFVEIDYNVSTGLSGGGTFFILGTLATFLIGILPASVYGGLIYSYHLIQPIFGVTLVLIASVIPGLLWVLVASPDRNIALFLAAGPCIAVILHLLYQKIPREGPQ